MPMMAEDQWQLKQNSVSVANGLLINCCVFAEVNQHNERPQTDLADLYPVD